MSIFTFNDIYFLLPPIWSFCFIWFFFLSNNTILVNVTPRNNLKINTVKTRSVKIFIFLYKGVIFFLLFSLFCLFGKDTLCLNNHLNITNHIIKIIWLFTVLNYIFGGQLKNLIINNLKITNDYIFILLNTTLLLPYLFCCNTLFIFIYLLELISCLLFYKLISSKMWYGNYFTIGSEFKKNNPFHFLNMVFFQYWVTFFSTIFFIYTLITITNFFGTVEWTMLNVLEFYLKSYNFTNQNAFIIVLLFFAFFCKLGIAPLQVFKVEVYNGLPLLSIFFYTVYYFLIFFTFFIFFLTRMVVAYTYISNLIIYLFLIIGIFYVISLLFDITQLKTFLTYSTVLNSIGFLILILVNL